jgi:hypothetical protein
MGGLQGGEVAGWRISKKEASLAAALSDARPDGLDCCSKAKGRTVFTIFLILTPTLAALSDTHHPQPA